MDQIFVNLKTAIVDFNAKFLPEWLVVIVAIMVSVKAILVLGPVIMMYLT